MVNAKCWKPDAIIRLLLSILICVYSGSTALLGVHLLGSGRPLQLRLLALVIGALILLAIALVKARQAWTLENFLGQVIRVLLFFYGAVFLGAFAQKLSGPMPSTSTPGQMVITTLSIQGLGIVLMFLFVREHEMSLSEAFGLDLNWRQALLYGALLTCLFLPVGLLLQQATFQVMTRIPHFPLQPQEQQAVQTLRQATSWTQRLALGTVTILVAPVAEEMLFRGVLYPAIKAAGFPQLALWGTSLVFAAIHFSPVVFLPLLVLALLLVWLYEKTGNLLAPITAHSLFNALNFGILYLAEKHPG